MLPSQSLFKGLKGRLLACWYQVIKQVYSLLKLVTATSVTETYDLVFVCCQRAFVDWVA